MPQYFAPAENINILELTHLIRKIPEIALAIDVGINDAICKKGLVASFFVRLQEKKVIMMDTIKKGVI